MVRRRFVVAVAFVLVLAVLGAPIGDVLAFGVHEHVAGADGDANGGCLGCPGNELGGVAHTAHHHCELSMNPAVVIDVCWIVTPGAAGSVVLRSILLALQSAPSVPQLPPRR